MPRKLRRPKGRTDVPLSPAAKYRLVTGWPTHTHMCGAFSDRRWNCEVDAALPPCVGRIPIPGGMAIVLADDETQLLEDSWEAHRDQLIEEAHRFGFKPAALYWFEGGDEAQTPLAAEVTTAWRREFMRDYEAPIQTGGNRE